MTRSRFGGGLRSSDQRGGVWEFVLFAGSIGGMQLARFGLSLVAAKTLPVDEFASWVLLITVAVFVPVLLFGVMNGMGREIPYYIGARRGPAAAKAESATWGTVLVALTLIFTGGIVAAVLGVPPLSALAVIIVLGMSLIFQVQQAVLRARFHFNAASYQQFFMAGAAFAVATALLISGQNSFQTAAGAYGLALSASVLAGVVIRRPFFDRIRRTVVVSLARIGFPILLAGVVFSLLLTEDRWIATAVLGPAGAAPYLFASVAASALLVVISAVSLQAYPRMARAFGMHQDVSHVYLMSRRQGLIAFAAAGPLTLALLIGAWIAIPRWLPQYQPSLVPMTILMGGLAILSLFTGYGNFLNVVGAQWSYLRVLIFSALLAAVLILIGSLVAGSTGIALGVVAGYMVYGGLLIWSARRRSKSGAPGPASSPTEA